MKWRPSDGVRRLAIVCGCVGMAAASYRYCGPIFEEADRPFWTHTQYEELLAKTKHAVSEKAAPPPALPPGFELESQPPAEPQAGGGWNVVSSQLDLPTPPAPVPPPGFLQYAAFAGLALPPLAGFVLLSLIVLSVEWVVDGFRAAAAPAPPAAPKP